MIHFALIWAGSALLKNRAGSTSALSDIQSQQYAGPSGGACEKMR